MSFTTEVKEEIAGIAPGCSHCEKATLAALIRIEGSVYLAGKGNVRLESITDSAVAARLMVRLLHDLFHLATELTVRRSVLHNTPNYLINVPMQPNLPEALRDMGILDDSGFVNGIDKSLVKKRCCAEAYLRGIFLGCGFVSGLKGDYHFELTVETEELAQDIVGILAERQIHSRYTGRRNNFIVYMKSGSSISAFLALIGAHKCALAMENERVLRSVRNDVNRQVNAEIANEMKARDASETQKSAIEKVVGWYGMSALPPALQEYILLRMANPDLSLRELGELADPPLSKSAIYHRVRRIEQMADEINL